jgi:hypothetical protein
MISISGFFKKLKTDEEYKTHVTISLMIAMLMLLTFNFQMIFNIMPGWVFALIEGMAAFVLITTIPVTIDPEEYESWYKEPN